MFKTLLLVICAAIGMVIGWEAKRYYTANRERGIKSWFAARDTWMNNAPISK